MRAGPFLLCAGLVVLAAAWREPGNLAVTKKVTIKFTCEAEGGATVSVKPWRVKLDQKADQIEWTLLPTGLDSVLITPKLVASWPFSVMPPIVVRSMKPGVGKGIPTSVPAGIYKYNVIGICNVPGAAPDTVVIDPDMIIPPA